MLVLIGFDERSFKVIVIKVQRSDVNHQGSNEYILRKCRGNIAGLASIVMICSQQQITDFSRKEEEEEEEGRRKKEEEIRAGTRNWKGGGGRRREEKESEKKGYHCNSIFSCHSRGRPQRPQRTQRTRVQASALQPKQKNFYR